MKSSFYFWFFFKKSFLIVILLIAMLSVAAIEAVRYVCPDLLRSDWAIPLVIGAVNFLMFFIYFLTFSKRTFNTENKK